MIREWNYMTVYDFFNNNFTFDCVISALNIPPISIDDTPHKNKRAKYTYDFLPDNIHFASGNSLGTFTWPYESPSNAFNICDITEMVHNMTRDSIIFDKQK